MTGSMLTVFVMVGVAAGILAGFFGVGGGVIIVPMLMLLLGYTQQTASGTSLVALLGPVGVMGVIAYYQAGKITSVEIKAGLIIACGMFFGTYLGSKVALQLSNEVLRKAFSVFLIIMALRLWFFASKSA